MAGNVLSDIMIAIVKTSLKTSNLINPTARKKKSKLSKTK